MSSWSVRVSYAISNPAAYICMSAYVLTEPRQDSCTRALHSVSGSIARGAYVISSVCPTSAAIPCQHVKGTKKGNKCPEKPNVSLMLVLPFFGRISRRIHSDRDNLHPSNTHHNQQLSTCLLTEPIATTYPSTRVQKWVKTMTRSARSRSRPSMTTSLLSGNSALKKLPRLSSTMANTV